MTHAYSDRLFLVSIVLASSFNVFSGTLAADLVIEDSSGVRIQDSNEDGEGDSGQQANQLWAGNIAGDDWASFFTFEMTGVDDPSNIESADFSVTQDNRVGTTNLQAFVFTKSASTVVAGDYERTDGTLLQTNFGSTTASGANPELVSLSTSGQSELLTFLQNSWVEGEFVVIRIRSNSVPATVANAYRFGNTTSGGTVDAELNLSIVAVPEPNMVALLVLGMVPVALRRKRSV